MKLKTILTFLYLTTSILVFSFLKAELLVWLSFFLNFLLLTGITYFHLNLEKTYSPFLTSFIVFFYLFCLVSPIIQISSFDGETSPFPQRFSYNNWDIIHANFLIFTFCFVFFFTYLVFKKKYIVFQRKTLVSDTNKYFVPIVILILLFVCISILAANFNYIIEDISTSVYGKKRESVFSLLMRKKFLFFVPLGGIVYTINYLKRKNRINTNFIIAILSLMFFLALIFFFKNPFTEKRNALGPIYIAIIYIFIPKLLNTNSKFFLFMFFSLVIVFPIMSTFTHADATISEVINNPNLIVKSYLRFGGVSTAYQSLHYDAFANIMATVDFVKLNGLSFGYQLLGTILFFIPRSFWTSKPLSTGELVGNHLIDEYGFNYNNLSNSIVSEGYINFGFLGVIFYAVVLSYFIIFFMKWLRSGSFLKELMAFYFAVHLIFLLRGDLTNGFSYFIGPLFAVFLLPNLVDKLFKNLKL